MRKPRTNRRVYVDPATKTTAADIMSVAHAQALIAKLSRSLDILNNRLGVHTDPERKAIFYKNRAIVELEARIVQLNQLSQP